MELGSVAVDAERAGARRARRSRTPPLNKPTLSIPARRAASRSQTASPTTYASRGSTPRRATHSRNRSGSGLARCTSPRSTTTVSSGTPSASSERSISGLRPDVAIPWTTPSSRRAWSSSTAPWSGLRSGSSSRERSRRAAAGSPRSPRPRAAGRPLGPPRARTGRRSSRCGGGSASPRPAGPLPRVPAATRRRARRPCPRAFRRGRRREPARPEPTPLPDYSGPMKVLSVVGNRPQFMKSGPLSVALREGGIEEVVLHTGQHWDRELSEVFFEELDLPEPKYRLDLHSSDPEAMEPGIAAALEAERPDVALVFGDTNSTLAGARAAVAAGIPLAHVEAGLRSGDLSMPEERNRIEVDRIAGLLLCPDERSRDTLRAEGAAGERRGRRRRHGRRAASGSRRSRESARGRSSASASSPGRYLLATDSPRGERAAGADRADRRRAEPARASRSSSRPIRGRAALLAAARAARADLRAARLPRPGRARLPGAGGRHRLGRPPEGGVLVPRALRDAAAVDRVAGHGRGRRERARGRRPGPARRRRWPPRASRGRARRSTATATHRVASWPLCTLGRPE